MLKLLTFVLLAFAVPVQHTEERPFDFDNKTCSASWTTVLEIDAARIVGRCERTKQSDTVLDFKVQHTGDQAAGSLHAFSLRFCGQVVNANGPTGWQVKITRESSRSGIAAIVDWELPSSLRPARSVAPGGEMTGFRVVARAVWRLALEYGFGFENTARAGATTHDCPYPYR